MHLVINMDIIEEIQQIEDMERLIELKNLIDKKLLDVENIKTRQNMTSNLQQFLHTSDAAMTLYEKIKSDDHHTILWNITIKNLTFIKKTKTYYHHATEFKPQFKIINEHIECIIPCNYASKPDITFCNNTPYFENLLALYESFDTEFLIKFSEEHFKQYDEDILEYDKQENDDMFYTLVSNHITSPENYTHEYYVSMYLYLSTCTNMNQIKDKLMVIVCKKLFDGANIEPCIKKLAFLELIMCIYNLVIYKTAKYTPVTTFT